MQIAILMVKNGSWLLTNGSYYGLQKPLRILLKITQIVQNQCSFFK